MSEMTIKALAPWYGANRKLAQSVGQQLGERRWTWIRQSSRSQQNSEVPEVLIINGPSFTETP